MDAVYKNGIEIPDKTPVEMPLGYEAPESLQEMVARMIVSLNQQKDDLSYDSPDDADDFDVMDEDPIESVHEFTEMEEEKIKGAKRARASAPEKEEVEKPSVATPEVVKPEQAKAGQ